MGHRIDGSWQHGSQGRRGGEGPISAAGAPSAEVLAGAVERVTFHNPENGFCVLRVKALGQRDLVTVVGRVAMITSGEFIQASGTWVNDRTHGQQFRAAFLKTTAPTSLEGIATRRFTRSRRNLSSPSVRTTHNRRRGREGEGPLTIIVSVRINDGIVMNSDSATTLVNGQTYLHADKIVNLVRQGDEEDSAPMTSEI